MAWKSTSFVEVQVSSIVYIRYMIYEYDNDIQRYTIRIYSVLDYIILNSFVKMKDHFYKTIMLGNLAKTNSNLLFRYYIMYSMILASLHLFASCCILYLHRRHEENPPYIVRVMFIHPIQSCLQLIGKVSNWLKLKIYCRHEVKLHTIGIVFCRVN